jgi:hypothetical protein
MTEPLGQMPRMAIHYPYIHIRDESWLKVAALYWPRMVPQGSGFGQRGRTSGPSSSARRPGGPDSPLSASRTVAGLPAAWPE